jgi:hypothetical protein
MVISKIEGENIYVDWDHRPWIESSFILDSEWGPTIEAAAKEAAVPKIEKGVPFPPGLRDMRHRPLSNRPPSKWVAFLKSLKRGDSFVIEYPEANTMKAHARVIGISLVWQGLKENGPNNMAQERVWRDV